MGISERREREKIERRKAILHCAKELILSQGVERVSMEDIAQKAELSKATLYLYFSGKEVLLNEICEESAQVFLNHFRPLLETQLNGIETLKRFWRSYVELFGSSDDMIIIFKVRNYLNSWQPIVLRGEPGKSPYVEAILGALKGIIDQCKAEGVFDPGLDSTLASSLLLSMFTILVENAACIPAGIPPSDESRMQMQREARKSPALIEEMTKAFQIIIRGFAREGIDRSCLDISAA